MKPVFLSVLMALFLLPVFAAAGEARFFESLYDVPVMPGLTEVPEQSLVFDKPDGRIAQSVAAGTGVTGAQIESFYEGSLPQLGWEKVGRNTYVRSGERLQLSVEESPGTPAPKVLRLTLAPL